MLRRSADSLGTIWKKAATWTISREENMTKHDYYPPPLWGCHASVTLMRWKQTETVALCVRVSIQPQYILLCSLVWYQWQSLKKCESVCLLFSQMELWHCLDNWDKWLSVQLSRWEKQQPATHTHTHMHTRIDILHALKHACAFMDTDMHD